MAEGGCTPNTRNKDAATFSEGDRKPVASDEEAGIKESSGSKLPVRHAYNNSTVLDGNDMDDDMMSREKRKKEILSSHFPLENIFQPAGATGGTIDRRENLDNAEENGASSDHDPGSGAENPEPDIEKREHVTPCNKNADPTDENERTVSNTTHQENEPPKEENQIELTSKLEKQCLSNSDNNARTADAATKIQEENMPAGGKHASQLYGTQNGAVAPYHVREQTTVQCYTEDNKPTFPPMPSADQSQSMKVFKSTRAHAAYEGLPRSHDKKSLIQDTTSTSKRSYTLTKLDTRLKDTDCVNGIGAASQDRLPSDASTSGAQLGNTPETRGEREHRDAEDPPCKTHNNHSVLPDKVTETKEHNTDSINGGVPLDTNVPSDAMPQTDASSTSNSGTRDSCEGETLQGNGRGEDTDFTSERITTSDTLVSATSNTQGFPELQDNSANDSGVDSGGNLSTFEERDSLTNVHLIGDTSVVMPQSSMSSTPSSVTGNQEHTSQQSDSPASDPREDGLLTTIPIWRSSLQGTSMALPEWSAASPFTIRLLVQLDLLLQRTEHFVVNLPALPGFLSTYSGTVYEGSIMSYSVNDLNVLEDPQELPDEGAVGGLATESAASYNVVTTTSTFTPTTTTVTTASATATTIATTTTVSSYIGSFESAPQMGIRHSPRISIVPLTSQPQQDSSAPVQSSAPWPAVRHRQPIFVPDLGPLVLLRWEFEVHDQANMGHRNTTVNLADGEELTDDTDLAPAQSEERNNSPVEFNIADDLEIIDGNDDASQDAANTTGDREVSSNVLMELWSVPRHQLMQQIIRRFGWGQGPLNDLFCAVCRTGMVNIITFQCHHRVLCHVCVRTCLMCPRRGCPRPRIEFFYRFDQGDNDDEADGDAV